MTNAEKLKEYKNNAERGYIYEFKEKDGTIKNDVLVVSSNARSMDKMISIIMIGDNPAGHDIVPVEYNNKKRYIHSELVTYTVRSRLGKKLYKVPDDSMALVTKSMLRGLSE